MALASGIPTARRNLICQLGSTPSRSPETSSRTWQPTGATPR